MILNSCTNWTILTLVFVLTSKFHLTSGTACNNDGDCVESSDWGNFSECIDGSCACSEFYVLHPLETCSPNCCIKIASYGKRCEQDNQCTKYLGDFARCGENTDGNKTCECYDLNFDTFHLEGKCIMPKGLGSPCITDDQCMFGLNGTKLTTNELARCVNNTCSCYMNHMIGIHTEPVDGICVIAASGGASGDCSTVDISVLAITLCGSVVLILFIYVMFRLATKDRKKEKQNNKPREQIKTDHNGVDC